MTGAVLDRISASWEAALPGRKTVVMGMARTGCAAAAALDIAPAQLVVVGDDAQTDVLGAQAVGARAVLVKTGRFRDGDLDDANVRPDLTLDSIAQLPVALGLVSLD